MAKRTVRQKRHKESLRQLFQAQVRAYGFQYSLKDFLKQMIVVCAGTVGIGWVFALRWPGILVVTVFTGCMLPWLVKSQFRYVYEQRRFADVVLYMEQMIYSFQKAPKIREALEDARAISSESMKAVIAKAIDHIDQARGEHIYEKAFAYIEAQYLCDRLVSLHRFLIQLEEQGGNYQAYLNILLEDIKNWNARTYMFQADMKKIRRNVLMSIGVTLLSSAIMTRMVPEDYGYTGYGIYQACISLCLMFMVFFYCMICSRLNISWLRSETKMSREQADQLYRDAFACDWRRKWMLALPWIGGFAAAGAAAGLLFGQWILAGIFLAPALMFIWKTAKTRQRALRRLEREVEKEYPDWLRQVALNLQVSTVQRAIFRTFDDAPEVLKPELKRLFHLFREYPTGVQPYNAFLDGMSLPEIQSSFRMLYGFHTTGMEDVESQIGTVMERNMKFSHKAEQLRNDDAAGTAGLLVNVPSLVGMVIIMLSMVLLIMSFSGIMGSSVTDINTTIETEI